MREDPPFERPFPSVKAGAVHYQLRVVVGISEKDVPEVGT
jgi:hypothetical protein